jgi:DNA-binding NtrC family response regulator
MLKLLAIDAEAEVRTAIQSILATEKVEIALAADAAAGLRLVRDFRPQVVLLAQRVPDANWAEVLETIGTLDPATAVIVIATHYSTEAAVEAIQKGAYDYLQKPLDPEKLRRRISTLIAEAEERHKVFELDQALMGAYQFEGIIGRSPAILQVFAKIRRMAPHFQTVLITGETGVGKELVARALHHVSPVAAGPMVVCNCSALVETLLESELFGHVRGAFTGAVTDKVGVFEYANGGTVFLDEIGELPLPAQSKLLRVLQNQEVQRVGSPATHTVNVRVVAATNRNLRTLVAEKQFRQDLFYRLSMIELELPSLAERREDIPLLQRYFVRKFAAQYEKEITGLTRRAQLLLSHYPWPGNVRELENVIGNACMMVKGSVIDVGDLPQAVRTAAALPGGGDPGLVTLEQLSQRHLLYVLDRVGGNKARAAEILGVSRATVYEMLSRIREHVAPGNAMSAGQAS